MQYWWHLQRVVNYKMIMNQTVIDSMSNVSSFGGMTLYANEISGGLIGVGIVLIVGVTLFITLKSLGKEMFECLAGSMFVATIVAVLSRFISGTSVITGVTTSLVGDKTMWACIVITALLVFLQKAMD